MGNNKIVQNVETESDLEETGSADRLFDDETLSAILHQTVKSLSRARHHAGHSHHAQRRIVHLLWKSGPISQRDMQHILDVRTASLSEVLIKLERQGLVSRETDERDRRNLMVRLTPLGKELVEGHQDERRSRMGLLFSSFTEEEKQTLGRLLNKLNQSLSNMDPERERHEHADGGTNGDRGHGHHGGGRGHGSPGLSQDGAQRHGHGGHHGRGRHGGRGTTHHVEDQRREARGRDGGSVVPTDQPDEAD